MEKKSVSLFLFVQFFNKFVFIRLVVKYIPPLIAADHDVVISTLTPYSLVS
jgi:hypothetical protein